MSNTQKEYRFVLGSLAPRTLPMARLATYLDHLARLLGETEHVRFERLEIESVSVVHSVDAEAIEKVERRILEIARGDVPLDARRSLHALKDCLAQDGATGSLFSPNGEQMLHLAANAQTDEESIPFTRVGTLDGVLVRIGGKGTVVPVHLHGGKKIHQCEASRETAREMAPYIFGQPLRVSGRGTWQRVATGGLHLKRFRILDYRETEEVSLVEALGRLRMLGLERWKQFDDPMDEIRRLRGYEDSE